MIRFAALRALALRATPTNDGFIWCSCHGDGVIRYSWCDILNVKLCLREYVLLLGTIMRRTFRTGSEFNSTRRRSQAVDGKLSVFNVSAGAGKLEKKTVHSDISFRLRFSF